MAFRYTYLLPIITVLWYPITFAITYTIAVLRNDVVPVFPYISDTGTWSPESCIFALMLNVGAIAQCVVIYIRYRQIRDLCNKNTFPNYLKKINYYSVILGCIASFGVGVVAAFQETNVLIVHLIGASMAFGLGNIYLWLQTVVSFKIYPTFGSKIINIVRLISTIICTIALWLTGGFGLVSFLQFKGDNITKWAREDGGYTFHFISVCSEWILAFSLMIFFASYTKEFKLLSVSEPVITVKT